MSQPGVLIDRLADAAWPAAEQVPLGPWKLRATRGVTRRANSAFTTPATDPPGAATHFRLADADVEALIEQTERFYAARDLPPCFQVSTYAIPSDLDAVLAARGYAVSGPTEIWTAPARAPHAPVPPGVALADAPDPDPAWFDAAFDEPAERRRVHEEIVHRVPHPRRFFSAALDGQTVGCAMAVSSAGHTGVFAMATHAAHRRRGIAAALLAAVAAWSAARGDHTRYLQVMNDNAPARALYANAGFAVSHRYHYRVR